nr:cyclin-dependent kinase C-1-like isoform X2 [Malus domestica]
MAAAAPGQINTEPLISLGSRSVDCFKKLEHIGEGTYGQVFTARETRTGEIVALKKIRMDNEKEGFPITAIREIKILKKLHHENVVKLKEIVTSAGPERDELRNQGRERDEQENQDTSKSKGGIYMVFEYMDHDLTGLTVRSGQTFTVPQVKCYMKQLLTGLHYCHVNKVLHRDIKGSNLLIDNEGKLKLADFGLAKYYCSNHEGNLTNRVITLWYRPPELLLGATKYGPAVDMWSVGCIFAELLHGKPILQGRNEPDQLNKIFELCGSPDEINWPDVSKLPWYNNLKPTKTMKRCVGEIFGHFDFHALDLLDHLLTLDPNQRWTAKQALNADYFWADPLPCDPKRMTICILLLFSLTSKTPFRQFLLITCASLTSLPKYESSHEFQTKKRKQQQQHQTEDVSKRSKSQHSHKNDCPPPIQHTVQAPPQLQGSHHPMTDNQPPLSAGPSHHHYGKPHGLPGGPSRYPPSGNQSGPYHMNRGDQAGGYSGRPYPPQGRAPPYAGSGPSAPSTGGAPAGYGIGPPNYSQNSQYGVPAADRGMSTRNEQYGRK